jgi:hypothetical protein
MAALAAGLVVDDTEERDLGWLEVPVRRVARCGTFLRC